MIKQLFFDLETTGVDLNIHAIHQMSGAIVIDGETKETFDFKIRPFDGAIIDDAAMTVGGVTAELLATYDGPMDVYIRLIRMLNKYCDKFNRQDKLFLAGYNVASFDGPFLRKFFERCGDVYFGSWFWSVPLDVIVLAQEHLKHVRHTMKDFKLNTVAEKLGIAVDPSKLHDALYDIELTLAVYNVIIGVTKPTAATNPDPLF